MNLYILMRFCFLFFCFFSMNKFSIDVGTAVTTMQ